MSLPAKKSLGQNFLNSPAALAKIIEAGALAPDDIVLEVGPGKGVLTEALLAALGPSGRVLAVEKDDRLIPFLQEKFAADIATGKLKIIHGDALDFLPEQAGLRAGSYKLIANIPYYITGAFIRKFLETDAQPEKIVILVQKEVAERVIARDGKESILSLSVKAYGTPRYVDTVKAGSFSPAPSVDSAILAIDGISKKYFDGISEADFFSFIKTAFAGKRKQLKGNLKEFENIGAAIAALGLNEDVRAEDIPFEKWSELARLCRDSFPISKDSVIH